MNKKKSILLGTCAFNHFSFFNHVWQFFSTKGRLCLSSN